MKHKSFRGKVYKLADGALHTYVPLAEPRVYIDQLMKNVTVGPYIQDHDQRLKQMLGHEDNPICDEIVFDYDLVEVCF